MKKTEWKDLESPKDRSWKEVHQLPEWSAALGAQYLMARDGKFRIQRVTYQKKHGAAFRKIHPGDVENLSSQLVTELQDSGSLIVSFQFRDISSDHALRICADSYDGHGHLAPLFHAALDRGGVDRLS